MTRAYRIRMLRPGATDETAAGRHPTETPRPGVDNISLSILSNKGKPITPSWMPQN